MSGLQKAIEIAGGQTALADLLTKHRREGGGEKVSQVKQGHVYYWLNTNLPPKIAREIVSALEGQVTIQELLPELFGDPEAAVA